MTAALEGDEWSAARPSRTLPIGKTRYPFYRRLGGSQGRSVRAENLASTEIFKTNILLFRYTVYIPAHVTATVSIVPAVRVFIGQGTLSLPPHHRAVRSTSLSYSILEHLAYIPCPLTSHCTRVQGWHTLRPMYNTESHPLLHLMGQGPLLLVCLHAPAVHAPYSHGSISVPLLPLPKHCNKSHPDAAAPRRVPLVGSWS